MDIPRDIPIQSVSKWKLKKKPKNQAITVKFSLFFARFE